MPNQPPENIPQYCKFKGHIPLHKGLLESVAWNELSKKQMQIFFYLYSCLQFATQKGSYVATNNGQIKASNLKVGQKLKMSKQTTNKGLHKLIEVGLIKIQEAGAERICHKYKILYAVVPKREERWRKYPEQDWKHEIPSAPNQLVGVKTRFKKDESHPNQLDNDKSSELDQEEDNSLMNHTNGAIFS